MPGAGRLGDKAQASPHPHGCPACPHPHLGPAILGSPNVMINQRPALRVTDQGIALACCGPNLWVAQKGSATVMINNLAAFRMTDMTQHCGSFPGSLIEGSTDVIIGG